MPQYLYDGTLSFGGGQNSGVHPDFLAPDQYRKGINVSTVGGKLRPRPGFHHIQIDIVTDGGPDGSSSSYRQIFQRGKFQSAVSFDSDSGLYLLAIISGIVFRIDPEACKAEVLPLPDGDRLDQYSRRINWSYAGEKLVFFDEPNLPVIVDRDLSIRRADPNRTEIKLITDPVTGEEEEVEFIVPEVPTSCLGTYVQGRLHVSLGQQWTSGDPTGNTAAIEPPITFEEVYSPDGAAFFEQIFSLPNNSANQEITYMGYLQLADTSTGFGPLLLGTKNSLYTCDVTLPRSSWEAGNRFCRILLYNSGPAGPRAGVNVNSDFMFIDNDCFVRSLSDSSQDQGRWNNTPISREVQCWLEDCERGLSDLSVITYYKNRVYITARPYRTPAIDLSGCQVADYANCGMVVLELDNASGLLQEARPAWAGLWTGINPMEMVQLDAGLFIFSKDPGGINRLYLHDDSTTYDTFEEETKSIKSRVYFKRYSANQPYVRKKVISPELQVSRLEGDWSATLDTKPSCGHKYAQWREITGCANLCLDLCNDEFQPYLPHCYNPLAFGESLEAACEELSKTSYASVRELDSRVTIYGDNWEIESFKVRFDPTPDNAQPPTNCKKSEEIKITTNCNEVGDWELYSTPTAEVWQAQKTET